ncbi:MAG: protein kinase [Planctomycetes bacterium]|nr:protein kinase [Planctomycetota bacterium]
MPDSRDPDGAAPRRRFELRGWKALPKPPGRMAGGYEIVSRGGVGRGHLALDPRTGRTVELHPLPWTGHEGEEASLRLEGELAHAAAVDHPNIVRLLGVARAEGLVYAVWEHARGRPLDGILTEMRGIGSRLTEVHLDLLCGADERPPAGDRADLTARYARLAARRIAGAAEGIAAAHAAGVLHAGIRPRILLLEADGRLRVGKIGVAGLLWHPDPDASDETAWYRPPECLRGEPPSPSADVFSLAAVLYEILTLRAAFPSRPGDRSLRRIESRPPVRPRKLVPDLPVEIETLVVHGMDPDASRRPEAAAFARDLGAFAEGGAVVPRRTPPPRSRLPEAPVRAAESRRTARSGLDFPPVRFRRFSLPLAGAAGAAGLLLIALALALSGVFRSAAPPLARASVIEGAARLWTDPADLFAPPRSAIEPARRLLSLALAAQARISEDEACECFQSAVATWPSCAEGWLLLGLAREKRADENPKLCFERAHALDAGLGAAAIRLDPARGDALPGWRSWLEAIDALRAQDPARARQEARAALAAGIEPPALEICARLVAFRAGMALGDREDAAGAIAEIVRRIRAAAGETSRAARVVEAILPAIGTSATAPAPGSLEIEAEDPAILLRASRHLLAAGDPAGAATIVKRAASADPDGPGWFTAAAIAAIAHLDAGRQSEAAETLRAASGGKGDTWQGALLAAAASVLADAPGDAAEALESAARKVSDPLVRDLARGESLRLSDRSEAAAEVFARVIDAGPPALPALLASTGLREARPAEAARGFGIAARAFPSSIWIAREWARALRAAGSADDAVDAYAALLSRIPASEIEDEIAGIARWLSTEIRADRAIGLIERAIRRAPCRKTFDLLLEIAAKEGRLPEAARFVDEESGRPQNIGVAEFSFQLGRIEEKLDHPQRALELIERALRLRGVDPAIAAARDRIRARLEAR